MSSILRSWNRSSQLYSQQRVFSTCQRLADSPLRDRSQRYVLERIVEAGPIRLNDVAEATAMTPSNASKIVEVLVQVGAVERTVPAGDRRVTLLAATQEGRELIVRLEGVDLSFLSDRLEVFADDEVAALAVLLGRFAEVVEDWSADPTALSMHEGEPSPAWSAR